MNNAATSKGLFGRRFSRGLVSAITAVCAAGALAGATAPAQAAAPGRVLQVSTAAQLEKVVTTLGPGDVLQLEPGTYDVGAWRPELVDFGHHAAGTAAAPITLTAADPARPPLLTGALKFDGASYWVFSHLRIQGTIAGTDTLTFNSGNGWSLLDSEVFGASRTGALANVVVAKIGSWSMPTNWTIAGNTIHDGGANPAKAGMQHEVYLTAVGNAHGLIARNVFFNTTEGAAVKIGSGGLANAPGINYVQVADNTMFKNFEQIVMHGNVSYNTIIGNLMVLSTRAQHDGSTVGVYMAGVTGTHNVIRNNYFFKVTKPVYNNASSGSFVSIGNPRRSNPDFDRTVVGGFRPRAHAAQRYGAFSAIRYWR